MKITLKGILKEAKRIRVAKQTGVLKMGEGRKPKKPVKSVDEGDTPWASSW